MTNKTIPKVCTWCSCEFHIPYPEIFQRCKQWQCECKPWACMHNFPMVEQTKEEGVELLGDCCEICAIILIQEHLNQDKFDLICICGLTISLEDCHSLAVTHRLSFDGRNALITKRMRKIALQPLRWDEPWSFRAHKYNGTGSRRRRPCPNCKTCIKKTGGCDHMTCLVCRTGFDWRDGEIYDQSKGRRVVFEGEWVAYFKDY